MLLEPCRSHYSDMVAAMVSDTLWLPPAAMATSYSYGYLLQLWIPPMGVATPTSMATAMVTPYSPLR